MITRSSRVWVWLLAGALAVPSPVAAQAVRGRVIDSVTRAPVAGALVELRDLQGSSVVQALTSATGAFSFLLVEEHKYQLRVAAIGYIRHAAIGVTSGSTSIPIEVRVQRVAFTLPELHAMAGQKACGASELNAEAFGGLLESARTSLQIMEATVRANARAFDVQEIRTMTRPGTSPEVVADTVTTPLLGWPVQSRPPDYLRQYGFAQPVSPDGGGYLFFGPDATVLFSDWFLDTHCFSLAAAKSDSETMVIRFDPASKPKHVDITGEMTLNARSFALKHLAFTHLNLPVDLAERSAGGEMTFARLADSAWVPLDWKIWVPLTRTERTVSRPTLGVGSQSVFAPPTVTGSSITRVIGRIEKQGRVTRAAVRGEG